VQSALFVYDAVPACDTAVSVRDSVALDKHKVALDGFKFDFEILETGAVFVTYIEVKGSRFDNNNIDYDGEINGMLSALNSGELKIGAKTTRGYGRAEVSAIRKVFDLLEQWLDFDMFDEKCWEDAEAVELNGKSGDATISLSLRQKGGISIRRYSTDIGSPDFIQLSLADGTPVIPGTSWAGAFRRRFTELSGDGALRDRLFGYVSQTDKNEVQKSKITFSESRLQGGTWKTITRNAIDRFSAGTKEGALYTEKTYYNGICELEIRMKPDAGEQDIAYIMAVVFDLHNGFLSIGGQTAVGRGLFEITSIKINGREQNSLLDSRDIGGALQCIKNG
ncbi:MAG: RAMP superfamily CRISPR-associated protein, partial [Eubacteriales bacterium]|nr:RAMP superfamily CRISPR-associated protein [Eubacteriales bacterium]